MLKEFKSNILNIFLSKVGIWLFSKQDSLSAENYSTIKTLIQKYRKKNFIGELNSQIHHPPSPGYSSAFSTKRHYYNSSLRHQRISAQCPPVLILPAESGLPWLSASATSVADVRGFRSLFSPLVPRLSPPAPCRASAIQNKMISQLFHMWQMARKTPKLSHYSRPLPVFLTC